MTTYSAELAQQNLSHRDLMNALDSWCTCRVDDGGALVEPCAGHLALGDREHRFEYHLEFGRFIAARLRAEEWAVAA
jgi:hypothetical protein